MSSVPPITVRPILYTEHVDAYLNIFATLGMATLMRSPGWTLVAGKAGRVAMHSTMSGRLDEGTVHLGFEVADLTAYAAAIASRVASIDGLTAEQVAANQGPAIKVATRDGMSFFVDSRPDGTAPSDSSMVVEPLWITEHVAQATEDFEALGLVKVMSATSGNVDYLRADEGQLLTHGADWGWSGTLLALDCQGDLDSAHAALLAAGINHDVIDETHGTTLKVPMPGTDETFWISKLDEDPVGVIRL